MPRPVWQPTPAWCAYGYLPSCHRLRSQKYIALTFRPHAFVYLKTIPLENRLELQSLFYDVQNMTGKVVLITGASTGMGRASAERLAQAGATVVGECPLCKATDCASEKNQRTRALEAATCRALRNVWHLKGSRACLPKAESFCSPCSCRPRTVPLAPAEECVILQEQADTPGYTRT